MPDKGNPKYRVCVYAISKNEENFVDRWVDSMSEADFIIVMDTGSADSTVKKLRNRGCIVFQREVSPWRFDAARNMSLSFVPNDCDICVCTDLDEVFEKGWRKKVEEKWEGAPDPKQMYYTFNYALKEDGTPAIVNQFHSKIHSRWGFQWVSPLHEYIACTKGAGFQIMNQGLVLNHYPDYLKDRSDYARLHRLGYGEGHDFLGEPV
ncbi:MAG: glycosyltransferase [Turicibacter sp.]|nr:glycosyltransferase [Turicibacter sp.]